MNPDTAPILTNTTLLIGAVFFGAMMLCIFITIWIVIDARHKAALARDREESRREIAAYVAEGSIDADDAERILNAGGSIGQRIMNELGNRKRSGEPRARRAAHAAETPPANEALRPQAT